MSKNDKLTVSAARLARVAINIPGVTLETTPVDKACSLYAAKAIYKGELIMDSEFDRAACAQELPKLEASLFHAMRSINCSLGLEVDLASESELKSEPTLSIIDSLKAELKNLELKYAEEMAIRNRIERAFGHRYSGTAGEPNVARARILAFNRRQTDTTQETELKDAIFELLSTLGAQEAAIEELKREGKRLWI